MSLLGKVGNKLFRKGSLTIIAPDGSSQRIGNSLPAMTVHLKDSKYIGRLLLDPELALGEAYMDGAMVLEGGDIYALFELCYANIGFSTGLGPMRLGGVLRRLRHRFHQRKSLSSARASVAHHYDLSGALYEKFLDEDRQYSCAYYLKPDDTLDKAQEQKKRHIAAKLLLAPDQSILDVGCGWGGLAIYLAKAAKANVTGITLSEEQQAYAQRRVEDAGLAKNVRILLEDYREHDGHYDRVVSVGMLEHVGKVHYDEYFQKIRNLLKDGGVALVHSICRVDGPGLPNPWMDKYIFPGGFIPSLSEVLPSIERAGLYVTDIEILRLHYALTLRAWRERFSANREQIAELYDERFCRMWEFYLAASEASFRRHGGLINFQIQLSTRVDTIALTRDYMLEWERAHAPVSID
jgi:cyclopropane-fatty-acyl-phospholipid synthase